MTEVKLKAESIMFENIPNGIQNIKGKGDGKPQYKAEKDIILKCMFEFAIEQLKQCINTEQNWENIYPLGSKIKELEQELSKL